jgi:N-ethylmaleimide reductase
VVDAVRAKGGLIFLQLWHVGRVSHSSFQPGGALPVSSSAVPISPDLKTMTSDGKPASYETPRALETSEISGIVEGFRQASRNALEAGFDGVEIHGANGYLIEQFLQSRTNLRTDRYGGSIENRARLLLEITQAVIGVWGANRVGVRLSPYGIANEGVLITAGGFTGEAAEAAIAEGHADAIAFGRIFISNPDLPRRLREGFSLTPYNRATFYGGEAAGYTDYPVYGELEQV